MITVLREDHEKARRDRDHHSLEAIELSIALSHALMSTAEPALHDEGRRLARDAVGAVRARDGAGAGETRFVESLAQSE